MPSMEAFIEIEIEIEIEYHENKKKIKYYENKHQLKFTSKDNCYFLLYYSVLQCNAEGNLAMVVFVLIIFVFL